MTRYEKVNLRIDTEIHKKVLDGEQICNTCKGTGLMLGVGLAEGEEVRTLEVCSYCYSGITRNCPHCGRLLGRYRSCYCPGAEQEREAEAERREKEHWESVHKKGWRGYTNYPNQFYIENAELFVSGIDEVIDCICHWVADKELKPEDVPTIRVYETTENTIQFDLDAIIEDNSDDLHDEAVERALEHRVELQKTLSKMEELLEGATRTYTPDKSKGVLIETADVYEEGEWK